MISDKTHLLWCPFIATVHLPMQMDLFSMGVWKWISGEISRCSDFRFFSKSTTYIIGVVIQIYPVWGRQQRELDRKTSCFWRSENTCWSKSSNIQEKIIYAAACHKISKNKLNLYPYRISTSCTVISANRYSTSSGLLPLVS